MTSHHDIIARLERSPAAWVCIRREAADRIKADATRIKALEAKLNTVKNILGYYADSDGPLTTFAAAVLREIEENSK